MAAIVTATIVQWEVVTKATKGGRYHPAAEHCVPCVCFRCCEMDCFYIADGASGSDLSPIIAQYISKRVKHGANAQILLQDAANGLLQVIVHQRTPITPPPVPNFCDELCDEEHSPPYAG